MRRRQEVTDALIETGLRTGHIVLNEQGLFVLPIVEAFRLIQAEYSGREGTPEYKAALQELRQRFRVGKRTRQ